MDEQKIYAILFWNYHFKDLIEALLEDFDKLCAYVFLL